MIILIESYCVERVVRAKLGIEVIGRRKLVPMQVIDAIVPELKLALQSGRNAVLVAAPGAGKTTRVPLVLLEEPWLQGKKLLMLEPRRLAARSAAYYMAAQLNETVGGTVGYRTKTDTKIGRNTRIEVITEGILVRMLQKDPALDDVGIVLFDEFHERSLQADLSLAMCLQSQELLRDDLKLLVMSATMQAEPVAQLLGGAPVVRSEGRSYPVDTFYRSRQRSKLLADHVAEVTVEALRVHAGDALVFLPGWREMREVADRLRLAQNASATVQIHLLHGSMPSDAQDAALRPAPSGIRKIVLSSAVAETSLTVEGVGIVIDSGLARVSRFHPRTGMSSLETIAVSAASADQRRGRAGRLMPGVCYRLWSQEERLMANAAPEIQETDLSSLLLELAVWGAPDPAELSWLDVPPEPALDRARELLCRLGALSDDGRGITAHGQRMAEFGMHPRLAHMLLSGRAIGLGTLACELAVVLSERDALSAGTASTDLRLRLEAMYSSGGSATFDERTRKRLGEEARRLQRRLEADGGDSPGSMVTEASGPDGALGIARQARCGLLLAFAYPDRIARRRESGSYLLSQGRGARLPLTDALGAEEWLVAAELDDTGADSLIRLAAPVKLSDLSVFLANEFINEQDVYWDREAKAVRARARKRLGAIVLEETPLAQPPEDRMAEVLLTGIRIEGSSLLPWNRGVRQLQERVLFLRRWNEIWPDWSDDTLMDTLESWLLPYIGGMRSGGDLQRLNLKELLLSQLGWERQRELDAEAPTHFVVPSGSRIPIDYSDLQAPKLSVRLQEMFGLSDSPRIAGGKVALTMELLSPAQRPVQVTRDLASFWRDAYFEVRKDLKGRYPKHVWPDNPLEAEATRRAKPRGQ